MLAHDKSSVTLPASTRPFGPLERAGRRPITAFRAAMVSVTFGIALAGVAVIRFNDVAWRGSQLLSAAILLAVAAGGMCYWRKAQVWLDAVEDLHS